MAAARRRRSGMSPNGGSRPFIIVVGLEDILLGEAIWSGAVGGENGEE